MGKLDLTLRWFNEHDIPTIVKIEQAIYAEPWSKEEFSECLKQRNCVGAVAEHNRKIVGYVVYEIHSKFLTILNLATSDGFRRKAVASRMVKSIKEKLAPDHCTSIYVRIHERNTEAIQFLVSQDFYAVGVIRNYFGEYSDAYEMRHQLPLFDQWAYYNRIAKYITT